MSGETGQVEGEDESDAAGLGGQREGFGGWIHQSIWPRWKNCKLTQALLEGRPLECFQHCIKARVKIM